MKCKECGHPVNSFKGLATHIQHRHDKKDYYNKYMKKDGEGLCKVCNSPTKFTILGRGYEKYCCKECERIDYSTRMTCKNPMKTESAQQNQRNTNLERYGVSQNTKRPEIKEQIKQTCLDKYGVENVIQVKEIKDRAKKNREETCMKEHGVKSYFSVKEVQDKIKQTYMKRYGVENPFQVPEIFERIQKTGKTIHYFKNLYYRGSYELDFLENFYNKFEIKQGLSFKYNLNEQNKVYHSDFYLPELNLIVEIKNSFLAEKDKEIIKKKKEATIVSRYNYIMIVDKDYSDFLSLSSGTL